MNLIVFTLFLFSFGYTQAQKPNACPEICHPFLDGFFKAQDDCSKPGLSNLCHVDLCQNGNGIICTLPTDSFILPTNIFETQDVVLSFTWKNNQPDLDTSIVFEGSEAGVECKRLSRFLEFVGDRHFPRTSASYIIDVEEARLSGLWEEKTSIISRATWSGDGSIDSATLTVSVRNKLTESVLLGSQTSISILPDISRTKRSCPGSQVAVVSIRRNKDFTRVTVTDRLL